MGCCLSKTNPVHPPLPNVEPESKPENITKISVLAEPEKKEEPQIPDQEEKKKEEEPAIQPRKSHDSSPATNIMEIAANGGVVRTSSCTKEEVDAILIQCGRLSRSSSTNKKYSGSKRSHDFDKEPIELNIDENEDDERQRRRQSRGSNRRTTPSRSRERDPQQKSGARRLSQSPRKRSEMSNTCASTAGNNRPGKLVSVPATVSSMSMEKSNNGENVKRVLVRRNVTPPRSRSPARSGGVKSGNQPSPSRNSSRKTEHSPYRRTALTDLDMNSLPFQPLATKSSSIKQQPQNKLGVVQGTHRRARSRGGEGSEVSGEQQLKVATDMNSGSNITRSRSQRRSRDLDVESLSNPAPATNYTSLLLQDIQKFHQKGSTSTSTSAPGFKLPECVSKACSIVEAVADLNLNSCTIKRVKSDDLMEPSLEKFMEVGKAREADEPEESSGSNSVVASSSWDLGSEGVSPASFQRVATSSNTRNGVARTKVGVGR